MYKLERKGRVRLTSKEVLTPSDFDAIAKELGVAPLLAQKIGFVVARRAEQIEQVNTYSGDFETKNTAQIGDWIVTNIGWRVRLWRGSTGEKEQDWRCVQETRPMTKPVTLADLIRDGKLLWVYCCDCCRERDIAPETIPLPPDFPVPDIGKRMKCSVCGSRKIDTRPELYPGGIEAMRRSRP